MSTKKHVRELLSVYIDQMCSAEEKKIVEAHLAECAECRLELEDLRKTITLVAGLKEIEPPADLWAGIEQRIQKKSFWEIFAWRPVPVVAATVTILLMAVTVNKYATRIAEQSKTGTMNDVTTGANAPLMAPLTQLNPVQEQEKKVVAKSEAVPAPAAGAMRYNELIAPQEAAGFTSVSQQKGKLADKDDSIQTPYEIEMDVDDMEGTRQRLESLADSYQARRVNQFGDDQEIFYHVQQQQLPDFIREVNKLGKDSRRKDAFAGLRETITLNRFGARSTAEPQLIRIKFNPSK